MIACVPSLGPSAAEGFELWLSWRKRDAPLENLGVVSKLESKLIYKSGSPQVSPWGTCKCHQLQCWPKQCQQSHLREVTPELAKMEIGNSFQVLVQLYISVDRMQPGNLSAAEKGFRTLIPECRRKLIEAFPQMAWGSHGDLYFCCFVPKCYSKSFMIGPAFILQSFHHRGGASFG